MDFGTGPYKGNFIFQVPNTFDISTFGSMTMTVGYLGPNDGSWLFQIRKNYRWHTLGDSTSMLDNEWSLVDFPLPDSIPLGTLLAEDNDRMTARVKTDSSNDDAVYIDYFKLAFTPLPPPPSQFYPSMLDTVIGAAPVGTIDDLQSNDSSSYMDFGTGPYKGNFIFQVPNTFDISTFGSMTMTVGYLGPNDGSWLFQIRKNYRWHTLGDSTSMLDNEWSLVDFPLPDSIPLGTLLAEDNDRMTARVKTDSSNDDAVYIDYFELSFQ